MYKHVKASPFFEDAHILKPKRYYYNGFSSNALIKPVLDLTPGLDRHAITCMAASGLAGSKSKNLPLFLNKHKIIYLYQVQARQGKKKIKIAIKTARDIRESLMSKTPQGAS